MRQDGMRDLTMQMHKTEGGTIPLQLRQAVVTAVDAGNTLTVTLDGTSISGVKNVESYRPEVNDTVWVLQNGGDLLAFGAVSSDVGYFNRSQIRRTPSPFDFNALELPTGFYDVPGNTSNTNTPVAGSGNWWYLIQLQHGGSTGYVRQIATRLNPGALNSGYQTIYTRYCNAGTWYDWVPLSNETAMAARRSEGLLMYSATATPYQWDGTNFLWYSRLIALGAGRGGHWATGGWLGWYPPASGVSVPGYGGGVTRTTVANGCPIGTHEALYGVPTVGAAGGSGVSLALVGYTSDFVVPDHWVLLAHRSESGDSLRVMTGDVLTPWKIIPTFLNGSTAYTTDINGSYTPRYRKVNGIVYLDGLINPGSTANPITVATLPAGYRPRSIHMVAAITSGAVIRRMDIDAAGGITFREATGAVHTSWHNIGTSFTADA